MRGSAGGVATAHLLMLWLLGAAAASSGGAQERLADSARDAAGTPAESGEPALAEQPAREREEPPEPSELFAFANSAYSEGDYARAVALYRQLLESGVESGSVYYNLGNALLRNGELGRAIAAYLRGQALRPRDRDLHANLQFARGSILDDLEPPSPPVLLRSLCFWHYSASKWELWRLAGAANAVFFALLALVLVKPQWQWPRILALLAGAVLLVAVASAGIKTLLPARTAVVIGAEAQGFNANSESSPVRFELHEGAEVAVVETREEWVRVRLPEGEEGWLTSDRIDVVPSW